MLCVHTKSTQLTQNIKKGKYRFQKLSVIVVLHYGVQPEDTLLHSSPAKLTIFN